MQSIGEVDDSGHGLRLHLNETLLIHHLDEDGHELAVELLLGLGSQLGQQQSKARETRVPHAHVGVDHALAGDLDGIRHVLRHALLASLCNQAHEQVARLALLPLAALDAGLDDRREGRHHYFLAQVVRDAVDGVDGDVVRVGVAHRFLFLGGLCPRLLVLLHLSQHLHEGR